MVARKHCGIGVRARNPRLHGHPRDRTAGVGTDRVHRLRRPSGFSLLPLWELHGATRFNLPGFPARQPLSVETTTRCAGRAAVNAGDLAQTGSSALAVCSTGKCALGLCRAKTR
jgi:hypothetical protein